MSNRSSAKTPHELLILGAGAALSSTHAKSAALLDSDVMIDTGADPTVSLRAAGIDPLDINHILLTHLHGDHFFGLAFMIAEGIIHKDSCRPLAVYGPSGTQGAVERLLRLAYPASEPSMFLNARNVHIIEYAPDSEIAVGPWHVHVLAQNHGKMAAFAFVFRHRDGTSVAFTGDGRPPATTLEQLSKCKTLVANTPTASDPIPAHASLDMYQSAKRDGSLIVCVHRTFDAQDESGVIYPQDGQRISFLG